MRATINPSNSEEDLRHFGGLINFSNFKSNVCNNNHKSILDSGASTSMFKNKSEVVDETYKSGSTDTVQLEAGESDATCIGKGTISMSGLKLEDSIQVDGLNETLISVGQVCDSEKIVVFTKNEAIIVNQPTISFQKKDILTLVPRNQKSKLYEFLDLEKLHGKLGSISRKSDIWHQRLGLIM